MRILVAVLALVLVVPLPSLAVITKAGAGTRMTAGVIPIQAKDTSVKIDGHRYVSVCNDISSTNDIFVAGTRMVNKDTSKRVSQGECWYSGERLDRSVGVWVVTAAGTATFTVEEAQ